MTIPTAKTDTSTDAPSMSVWSAAWEAQDIQALRAIYAADGVVMHPKQPLVRGPEAIGRFFERGMGKANVRFEPLSLTQRGELAFESGVVRDLARDTDEVLVTSDYVVTWIKVSGEWRILAHAWNSLSK